MLDAIHRSVLNEKIKVLLSMSDAQIIEEKQTSTGVVLGMNNIGTQEQMLANEYNIAAILEFNTRKDKAEAAQDIQPTRTPTEIMNEQLEIFKADCDSLMKIESLTPEQEQELAMKQNAINAHEETEKQAQEKKDYYDDYNRDQKQKYNEHFGIEGN